MKDMSKYTVEAKYFNKVICCNCYETISVDSHSGNRAMDMVAELLAARYGKKMIQIQYLHITKIENFEQRGNDISQVIIDEF